MTITQNLSTTQFLNAFNNGVVEFTEALSQKAVITTPLGPFEITPNGDNYYFNFKEIFKSVINQNLFSDSHHAYVAAVTADPKLWASVPVTFETFDDLGASIDSQAFTYKILKSVDQLAVKAHSSPYSHDEFNNDIALDMYEGLPFDFGVRLFDPFTGNIALKRGTEVINKGLSAAEGLVRVNLISETGDLINLQGAGTTVFVPGQRSTVEVNTGAGVKTMTIDYRKKCGGLYLKWMNKEGAWDYGLFTDKTPVEKRGRQVGVVSRDFENLSDTEGLSASLGKTVADKYNVSQPFLNKTQFNRLLGLEASPKIYLWANNKFIEVLIETEVEYLLREAQGVFAFSIIPPAYITQKI